LKIFGLSLKLKISIVAPTLFALIFLSEIGGNGNPAKRNYDFLALE
jgi:hypothetical protein